MDRPGGSGGFAVGIDIGGTKTAVGLVDEQGRVLARLEMPTRPELGFERAVRQWIRAVEQLLEQVRLETTQLRGIGVGCAGPVDPRTGRIHNPYTLPGWEDCDVVTALQERFGVKVRLENDADAAVVGEWWVGAARGHDPVVMLTFGTGVGGGILLGGRIYRGSRGQHPELGHVLVSESGPRCYCGMEGCLESLASGTALATAGTPHGWTEASAVLTAAEQGHPVAQAIVARATRAAADAAWTLAHAVLPARFVLGGGLMRRLFDRFAAAMRERWARATQIRGHSIEVCRAALGSDAGLVGAAALGLGRLPE
ncbi:ROK family protein [Limisphaera sp. VF-2]|jgi:glucokinase|uniref:ROK family protein n=1 Tax=Limisphaera sp. VF-2 TaxID=3400418 RepID=UPI001773F117